MIAQRAETKASALDAVINRYQFQGGNQNGQTGT